MTNLIENCRKINGYLNIVKEKNTLLNLFKSVMDNQPLKMQLANHFN